MWQKFWGTMAPPRTGADLGGVHRVHVHPPLEPEFKYSFVIKSTTAIIIYIVCDSCGYDNST